MALLLATEKCPWLTSIESVKGEAEGAGEQSLAVGLCPHLAWWLCSSLRHLRTVETWSLPSLHDGMQEFFFIRQNYLKKGEGSLWSPWALGSNDGTCPNQGYQMPNTWLPAGVGGQREGLAELLDSIMPGWAPPQQPCKSLERLDLPLPQK